MTRRPKSSIPKYKRRRQRSLLGRLLGWIVKLILAFVIISILWVLAYRFVNPPITITMIGDLVAGRGATRDWMPLSALDRDAVRAAIAAEDGKFCSHHGFDFEAMEDAMKRNASGGRIRGGSTISQQTAKNVFLWPERSWVRKGAEAWFTLLIETIWGKRRIMEVYLNTIELGPGIYGVEAASQHYFRKPASALGVAAAGRIAAIIPSPLKWKAARPGPYVRRRTGSIEARTGTVARGGLDDCVVD